MLRKFNIISKSSRYFIRSYRFEKPRNIGSFDKNDINVVTAIVGAPA